MINVEDSAVCVVEIESISTFSNESFIFIDKMNPKILKTKPLCHILEAML